MGVSMPGLRMTAALVAISCLAGGALGGEAVSAKRKPSDRAWRGYRTDTLADLREFRPAGDVGRCDYGGLEKAGAKAGKFFRTSQADGRWWLIDPHGHPFLSVGVNSVGLLGGRKAPAGLGPFRSTEDWADRTASELIGLGFNTLGGWSDFPRIRKSARPMPYTISLNFAASYRPPDRVGKERLKDVYFIFDPGFEEHCRKLAEKALADTREDPYVLGVFSDNEIPWHHDLLRLYLDLPEGGADRREAEMFLARRGGGGARDRSRITDDDCEAFAAHLADRYFRVVAEAIRRADPNHLYLGARLHAGVLGMPSVLAACGRHADMVSVNWYNEWTPDANRMDLWVRASGKPFLITEFYAKGADTGLKNEDGAGWLVKTQQDRGRFYQNFALGLLAHPGCVGFHWFRYIDKPEDESNKGIYDKDYRLYKPLSEAMRELNRQVYPLAGYFRHKGG